ncbi:MAG TPA: ABC transporter substrate-binding protein [Chloroflexota bacterium]
MDRHEPTDLYSKILAMGGSNRTKRMFNAWLSLVDNQGLPRAYLAEALPQLNTDSWRVLADGHMETSYHLRAGTTWQDGAPLTTDDFLFALRVYQNPRFGVFSSTPQDLVEQMSAPDPRTLVIRWRTLYPDAAALAENALDPLPRHILEPPYQAVEQDPSARDAFLNHPFWTSDYIGAGPFKLQHWDQGIQMEANAFEGHVLGAPHITRIVYRFMTDEDTILANVLGGEIQFTAQTSLRFDQGLVLQRDWVSSGRGSIILQPTAPLYNIVQFRPEYQKTAALLDPRVRKALMHAIDRQGINEVLYEGESQVADTVVSRRVGYYDQVDATISKYPLDSRRTEQLLNEAGFGKDRDGLFVDASGARFRPDFEVLESLDYERVGGVINDGWRKAGIDVQYSVLPNAQVRVNEVRQTFAGIATPGAGAADEKTQMTNFTAAQIGTPVNRWSGSNRGGWNSAEFDRLFTAFNTTIDAKARSSSVVQAMKLMSEELPAFPLYYNIYVLAVIAGLKGPGADAPSATNLWNIYDWERSD